jgi:hypothetical protein
MPGSKLSYSVSRNYPYRFLTPLAILGGLAFLAVFSLINYASSGFSLVVQYTTDPNITVSKPWLGSGVPKAFANKMKPSCESTPINGQTKLATTNNALFYTITSVESSNKTLLPSLVYFNNPLESCNISHVAIHMEAHDRTAAQIAVAYWGVTLQSVATCRVELEAGPVTVNLTTEWDPFTTSITTYGGYTRFLGRDPNLKASLYWGESLLANYRILLGLQLEGEKDASKQEITFTIPDSNLDITDLAFFETSWRGIVFNRRKENPLRPIAMNFEEGMTLETVVEKHGANGTIWLAADSLAKSFYSTILTDLGQATANNKQNILQSPQLLQHFTANFSTILSTVDSDGTTPTEAAGPAMEDYDTLRDTIGPLAVMPATLAVNYICNVPRRKPWSELIVSILVANLVFMRTLWSVFNLVMEMWVKDRDGRRNWCEGCLKLQGARDDEDDFGSAAHDAPENASQSSGVPLLTLRKSVGPFR